MDDAVVTKEPRRGRGRSPGSNRTVGRPAVAVPQGGVWKCSHEGCERTFTHRYNLNRHVREHNGPAHLCDVAGCQARYFRPDALRAHYDKVHAMPLVIAQKEMAEAATVAAQRAAAAAQRAAAASAAKRMLAETAQRATQVRANALAQAKQAAEADVLGLGVRLAAALARVAQLQEGDAKAAEAARAEDSSAAFELVETDMATRTDKCAKCKELRCQETNALPHLCYVETCGRRYHSFCAGYHYELHPESVFFCPVCLPSTGVSANGVEQAAAERASLPSALEKQRLIVSKVDANGECLFEAISRGTKASHGDARTLMQKTGEALVRLRAFVDTPVRGGESADLTEWRRKIQALKVADPKNFTMQLKEASKRLADGKSTYGEGWNSAAMDVAPFVLPALIGRPIHIWEYSLHLRKFPDPPIQCEVLTLPGVSPCPEQHKQPVHLLRTKAAVKLAHYDLLVPRR